MHFKISPMKQLDTITNTFRFHAIDSVILTTKTIAYQ